MRPELADPCANRPRAHHGEHDQTNEHSGDDESDDAHVDQ
jgi:hypothetical protein